MSGHCPPQGKRNNFWAGCPSVNNSSYTPYSQTPAGISQQYVNKPVQFISNNHSTIPNGTVNNSLYPAKRPVTGDCPIGPVSENGRIFSSIPSNNYW